MPRRDAVKDSPSFLDQSPAVTLPPRESIRPTALDVDGLVQPDHSQRDTNQPLHPVDVTPNAERRIEESEPIEE